MGQPRAYYNEIDPAACAILEQLIADGVIMPGIVDSRSIKDVQPDDLRGFTQCHFFAGGGLWSVAARMAGWPDERPLWTGSCPCQPFSAAGKGLGTDDPRHLWPDFYRLIRECRPAIVFGEQVSTAAGTRRPIDPHMHEMWRREAILGLLQEPGQARQFEWLSCAMQGVLQGEAGELSDWYEAASVGFLPEVSRGEPGEGACECGANAGEAGGHPVRSGRACRCHSGEDRQGDMRADRTALAGGWRSDVGQSIARPDYAGTWLSDHQRSGGVVRSQRDDEHLGRGADPVGGRRNTGAAGKGRGGPAVQVGEETEGTSGIDWLDGIRLDLDAIGYSTGVSDIPACAIDAPHQRNRLYWVAMADADSGRRSGRPEDAQWGSLGRDAVERAPRELVDSARLGRGEGWPEPELRSGRPAPAGADASGVTQGDALGSRLEGQPRHVDGGAGRAEPYRPASPADGRNGSFWSDAEWIICHDDKARRTQPGLRLLVDGLPGRVDLWRVGGNAIVPVLAAEVIKAFLDAEADERFRLNEVAPGRLASKSPEVT